MRKNKWKKQSFQFQKNILLTQTLCLSHFRIFAFSLFSFLFIYIPISSSIKPLRCFLFYHIVRIRMEMLMEISSTEFKSSYTIHTHMECTMRKSFAESHMSSWKYAWLHENWMVKMFNSKKKKTYKSAKMILKHSPFTIQSSISSFTSSQPKWFLELLFVFDSGEWFQCWIFIAHVSYLAQSKECKVIKSGEITVDAMQSTVNWVESYL